MQVSYRHSYIHTYIHICMKIFIHLCMSDYTCMHSYIHTYISHSFMYVYLQTSTSIQHVCMYGFLHTYMDIYVTDTKTCLEMK